TLNATGAVTAAELAERASIARRYAEEWLDQQAATGVLDVVDADPHTGVRRFELPAPHAAVLLDPTSPAYLMGAAPLLLGIARTVPAVADAFATGRGVDYAEFGPELRFGI